MLDSITDVPGVSVGHYSDTEARTGVTVLTFPSPNFGAADVRGGAPGTRELGLFGDAIKPIDVNALMFAGGSAFGLAAAQGIVDELETEGIGAPTPAGPVPIVPAAIIFDLMDGRSDVRPGAEQGRAAYVARSSDPVQMGRVGAGTGATVGKINGFDRATASGLGSASSVLGPAVVGALVVLNAVGDVFALDGSRLTGTEDETPVVGGGPSGHNTTLIAVATNADISDRNELRRMGVRAHDALGATVRPAHTRYDGDTAFVISSPREPVDIDVLVEATFDVVVRAIHRAVEQAAQA